MPWLDAHRLIDQFGQFAPYAVAAIVFVETAFIVTSFLPGDSLLFVLGLTLAANTATPLWLALAIVTASAIAGSHVGFVTGRALGPILFERRHTWIFNPRFVAKTHEYFARFGNRAIVLARFVPIVRALVPMLAGISRVPLRAFTAMNVTGAALWVGVLTTTGFFLGEIPAVEENIDVAILVVIIATSLPFPIEILRETFSRRRRR